MLAKLVIGAAFGIALSIGSAPAEILELQYEGFTTWVDCDRRGPVLFHYVAERDVGTLPRQSDYAVDTNVEARCQSKSNETFQSVITEPGIEYDVGHQAPANHFDHSLNAIAQTNFWTNLLPQTKSMNRGAWLATEEIIECVRDEVSLEVWGGPIWGSNFDDDLFVESHGVQTPAAFWKVVIRTDDREAIAWIVPNGAAPRNTLDQWIESVSVVEKITGQIFEAVNKDSRPIKSWEKPAGCNLS